MARMGRPTALARIARSMGMSQAVWRRHANPWSVWTRFTCLPLLVLAIWSRDLLGWAALIPVVLSLLWIWANPRVFPEPASLDSWGARAVLGERIHIYRPDDVAPHHILALKWLTWAPLIGVIPLIWGVWTLDPFATITGVILTALPKMWFCDRMVWIAQDWQAAGHHWAELDDTA